MSISVGELYATLKLERGAFERGLHQSHGLLGGLGNAAKLAGIATAGALVGIGVEATKMAAGFQEAMELITTQAGASQEEVENLKGSVLGLAGEVGTAPEILAAGLYHLESAGMRGAKAMEVLKIAAQGAKVGHADLEATTNSLVAALKSGVGGITDAGQAMGVLNAIVGAGNMRMEDLTSAIGTGILSTAKNFGVSIQSVGAALAAMTDQGIPAVDAANSLRSAMRLMAAPTSKAKDELKSIGLSGTALAKDMRGPGGMQAALVDLKKHMESAGLSATQQAQLLTAAFGGKQSQGILTLVGNLDVLDEKTKAVAAGTGSFAEAWAKTQEDVALKGEQTKASFDALMITLGDKLLPVAGAAFDGLRAIISSPALISTINTLGDAMAGIATIVGRAFSAIGPAISSAAGAVGGAVGSITDAFGPIVNELAPVLSAWFESITTELLPALAGAFSTAFATIGPIVTDVLNLIATEVLPRFSEAMSFVTSTVIPALADAITWISTTILPPIAEAFRAIAENVIPILAAAFGTIVAVVRDNWPTISAIAGTVAGAVKTAVEGISAVIRAVAPVIRWLAETIFPILGAAAGVLLGAIDVAFKAIGVIWNAAWTVAKVVVDGISAAFNALVGVFQFVGRTIASVFRTALNVLVGVANGIIAAINSIQIHIGRIGLDTPAGFIGVGPFDWNGLQLPSLRYLAKGGVVTAPTLAMLGEGNRREAVLPLDDPRVAAMLSGRGEVHRHYELTVQGDVRAPDQPSVLVTLQRMAEVGA